MAAAAPDVHPPAAPPPRDAPLPVVRGPDDVDPVHGHPPALPEPSDPLTLPAAVAMWGRACARRCRIDPCDGESIAAQVWAEHQVSWRTIAHRRIIDEARHQLGRTQRPTCTSLDAAYGDGTLADVCGADEPGYSAAEARVDVAALVAGLPDADVAALARHFWLGQPWTDKSVAWRARAHARGEHTPRAAAVVTGREAEVLQLAAGGMVIPDMAKHLGVSRNTIKAHLKRATAALGASNTTSAVAAAIRAELI